VDNEMTKIRTLKGFNNNKLHIEPL